MASETRQQASGIFRVSSGLSSASLRKKRAAGDRPCGGISFRSCHCEPVRTLAWQSASPVPNLLHTVNCLRAGKSGRPMTTPAAEEGRPVAAPAAGSLLPPNWEHGRPMAAPTAKTSPVLSLRASAHTGVAIRIPRPRIVCCLCLIGGPPHPALRATFPSRGRLGPPLRAGLFPVPSSLPSP